MIFTIIASLSLAIWVYLLLARGQFWRVSHLTSASLPPLTVAPRVAVIIPARNEAEVIGPSLRSVLLQNYPGELHVVLVDDDSSDNTAAVAQATAAGLGQGDRVLVIRSTALPPGWTGKLWAVSQGITQAAGRKPEFLWLTDADIVHGPDTLTTLVAQAQSGNFDLVSFMVKLRCETWAERALVPAFVFFFFKLYPPAWVANDTRKTAAAAGGCILVRSETLRRIGGIESIRDRLIDDCALAQEIKRAGRIWMGLTPASHSIRGYATWGEIARMISRTAFTQLRHSILLLIATLAAMAVTYLAPPVLVWAGDWTSALALIAWALMAIAYVPMLRFYQRSFLWAPLLPLVATFYAASTVYSALQYWTGKGGEWKGRVQDPAS